MMNLDITFKEFWAIYPRKTGDKARAEKLFNSLKDVERFNAFQGAKYHSENNPQWKNPSLIPHPTTFLKQKRWLNEIVKDTDAKARVIEKTGSLIDMVWSAMTQMYGESWIKKFGENPSPIWRKLLQHIPEERIKRGLRACYESGSEFPPSLPKFAEYCARRFDEIHPHTALTSPVTDTKTALGYLAEARKILRP